MLVRGPIAAAMAWASARKSLPTGMRRPSSPSHSAALLKAGWAVCGTTICGRSMAGRLTRAQSRADLTARKMLSVPPVVMAPRAPAPPCSSPSVIATTSLSNRARLGDAVGIECVGVVADQAAQPLAAGDQLGRDDTQQGVDQAEPETDEDRRYRRRDDDPQEHLPPRQSEAARELQVIRID